MRICSLCKIAKPTTEYHKHKNGKDGLRSRCKDCNRMEARGDYRRNPTPYKLRARKSRKKTSIEVRDWLREIKALHGCCICGIMNPVVLEFHHIDMSLKVMSVTTIINKGRTAVQNELNKCAIVCANCHKLCHAGQIIIPPEAACKDVLRIMVRGVDY